MKKLFVLLLGILAIVFVIMSLKLDQNKTGASNYLDIIRNAPSMLNLTNNSTVRLGDYVGKYIILEVWEVTCPACRKAIPELIKFNESYTKLNKLKNDVVFFSFLSNSSGSNSEIVNFIKQNGINYPVLLDNDYYIAKNFGVRYIPSLFIIDKDGNLRYSKVGPESSSVLQAELLKIVK